MTQFETISEKLDNAKILLNRCIKNVEKRAARELKLKQEKTQKTDGFKHFLDTMNIKTN